ncbi:hypothetical protein M9458_037302, partial [Cirrhinus mrigala]
AQNGTAITKKLPISLPELEYKEKGKDGGKDKKQQQQHSIGINNNILQTVDAKLQDIEYMENHLNTKRLNNEFGGSAENLFLKEEVGGGGGGSAPSKHYKNSSPHSHNSANGSVPEKKQKCAGKNLAPHRDLMENCIPNNQLSKPDALVRLEQDIKKLKADLQASRQVEQDLRSQINSLSSAERSMRSELGQLRQENELLQN